jgi:hypothetical protein
MRRQNAERGVQNEKQGTAAALKALARVGERRPGLCLPRRCSALCILAEENNVGDT